MSQISDNTSRRLTELVGILGMMNGEGQDRLCSFARQLQMRFPAERKRPRLQLISSAELDRKIGKNTVEQTT